MSLTLACQLKFNRKGQEDTMEIPTLFYRQGTCSLGSMIVAEWTKLPYQLCRLEKVDAESPDFLRINPLGEVPVLKIGRSFLTESFAILQHLALQHPRHGLDIELTFPYGHASFDQMNQVLAYLVSTFHKSFAPLFDPSLTRETKHRIVSGPLLEQMNFVDRHLVDRGLIFGQRTIADAYLYGVVRWANGLYDIPAEFPSIANFQSILDDDEGVRFAVDTEKRKPARTSGMFLEHVELKAIADLLEPADSASSTRIGNTSPTTPGLQIGDIAAAAEADQARADGASLL
jgi:glutathione S-transferase